MEIIGYTVFGNKKFFFFYTQKTIIKKNKKEHTDKIYIYINK